MAAIQKIGFDSFWKVLHDCIEKRFLNIAQAISN